MKIMLFQRPRRALRYAIPGPRAGGMVALSTLFLASHLAATPTVTTVTGGPSQSNPSFFGYRDGDTKALAQFHTPIGLALDGSGNFLLVADRNNNAIRILDIAGNLT